jgi:hypothetical protein
MSETKRKLIPVPDYLLKDISKAAERMNTSTGKFIEEALKQAVHANMLGYSPGQFVELCEVMQAYRVLGGVFVPTDVLNYLTSTVYTLEKEQLQQKWYECGVWYGKFLKEKFENHASALKSFLLATRWDLNEVHVTAEKDTLKVRCVSPILTTEETELLVRLIDGIMNGAGYQPEKHDYIKGIIALQYRRVACNMRMEK